MAIGSCTSDPNKSGRKKVLFLFMHEICQMFYVLLVCMATPCSCSTHLFVWRFLINKNESAGICPAGASLMMDVKSDFVDVLCCHNKRYDFLEGAEFSVVWVVGSNPSQGGSRIQQHSEGTAHRGTSPFFRLSFSIRQNRRGDGGTTTFFHSTMNAKHFP